ncbi:MAG: D-glycero-beta-D-manno-heptose 1-phosphate adenylyltransferase [Gammaproteobacteria bacterium]|nr:MAG: D-glycero-beta-D-manno-heptose 1-phosphate adenylyltransferase [Gammaproteobacteria bacterium]
MKTNSGSFVCRYERKLVISDPLAAIRELPRPLVFTNGCFDILHRGHIDYLDQARQLGNSLLVAINSDESVKRQNKGTDRPINPLEDRMALLAALEAVDAVIAFAEETPFELIKLVKPEILVKGGDWPVDEIVGADLVTEGGGKVMSIPFRFQRSTSALLEQIRNG